MGSKIYVINSNIQAQYVPWYVCMYEMNGFVLACGT